MKIKIKEAKHSDKEIRNIILDNLILENGNIEENTSLAKNCRYSIIENYMPDCPGQTGDIITIVYGYSSCIYTFFIKDNKLDRIYPEV